MLKKVFMFALAMLVYHESPAIASSMEKEFEDAWKNPTYTKIELEPLDINHILSTYYITEPKLTFTRAMLWDLERKKGWNPEVYIAPVIEKGSWKSWNKKELGDGNETFVRATRQRQWLDSNTYGDVFEKVFVNNKEEKVTFIGASELLSDKNVLLHAKNSQPLFHVEHGVKGKEDHPLNTWRIVFITKENDDKLIKSLHDIFKDKTKLPVYVSHYIEHDLGVKLKKKDNNHEK